MILIKLN